VTYISGGLVRWYHRKLAHDLVITQARPEHALQLEELQRICFPTLADDERLARRLRSGSTSTQPRDDSFADIIQGGWLTSHQPHGAWLYGADVSVRPEYRGRGLATALYVAWREVVWRLKLKGQVTAGLIPGYGALKETMPVEQ
jgi:GNAT superfamily N-acetyltransferase